MSVSRVGGQSGAPEVSVVEVASEIDPRVVPVSSKSHLQVEKEAHRWPVTRCDRNGNGNDDHEGDTRSVGRVLRWDPWNV